MPDAEWACGRVADFPFQRGARPIRGASRKAAWPPGDCVSTQDEPPPSTPQRLDRIDAATAATLDAPGTLPSHHAGSTSRRGAPIARPGASPGGPSARLKQAIALGARTLAMNGAWRPREAAGSQAVSNAHESSLSLVFMGSRVPYEYK
ncbi:hypothetical protein K458DRAFT_405646 [Lentithecium fluviatile CBS 122367]|uniref:Uncharacterized protein n=1 Tax=Lentithecium fluviatile CBS 122367 TaxID=1168545 RepID=A0A6G1IW66_9PLEO|nr:hypothetical protein K458DRAFT_405646 [Lentithecium fluviatile CBS 122367]